MKIQTFLTECLLRGIFIDIDGDSLRVESDHGLKPATIDYIRQHKPEIIKILSEQEHGTCVHCGKDTASMLTKPGTDWMWCCSACFDRGAEVSTSFQNAVQDDCVSPI